MKNSVITDLEHTRSEKNRYEAIFNTISEGIFTIDNDWKIQSFNRSAEEITGYSREEALGQNCWNIFQSSICQNRCHMETTLREKRAILDQDLTITRKNGRQIDIRLNSQPLFNEHNECIGGVESFRDISDIKNLSHHLEERYCYENIIGRSKSMQIIYDLLENVAQTDSTVLITGESGTGKELVARALHLNSDRKTKPFVTVNCSAFVENLLESELFGHEKGAFTGAVRSKQGRFELTQGGSLFLDEIGDITPHVQVKLLRVLENRHFERVGGTTPIKMDGRIIAATNKDLQQEIRNNRFREDLFYRINVVNIHLPPLRERMEDLPLLVQHFMDKFRYKFKKEIDNISSAAFKILKEYHWPGNIRELENVLEHTFVLCNRDTIDVGCLPKWLLSGQGSGEQMQHFESRKDSIREAEKFHIKFILEKCNGHRGKTAEALGINKSTLWRKMKKYDLLS